MKQVLGSSFDGIHQQVQESYASVANQEKGCCGAHEKQAIKMGYSEEDVQRIPEGANLGLGCGNPLAIASLQAGEVVLDLGSGAGFDCLLAAKQVGSKGRVIGIDMTPEMLAKARKNAVRAEVEGFVEFREGLIEQIPAIDASVDLVMSNCVINLSPHKNKVFQEAYRVLKPGGRLVISDILLSETLDAQLLESVSAYAACIGGAVLAEEYLHGLQQAGFTDITWTRQSGKDLIDTNSPFCGCISEELSKEVLAENLSKVWSYHIQARKPDPNLQGRKQHGSCCAPSCCS